MKPNRLIKVALAGVVGLGLGATASFAQEVTLRLHQFLPPQANLPANVMVPWAESVEEASGGRIAIEHFDAMALGGRPPELYDQARDGVVDIAMTLPGYTPNRFVKAEVFELPFMMRDSVATSLAFWEMVETELQDTEFADVQILGAWVHGPGVIHTRNGVNTLEDMDGLKLRGPTRVINGLLEELGAVAVGMPVPAIPEALSKGVVDGTVIPWEVTPALKLSELVSHGTEFSGDEALYTATFVLAMNKARFDAMPEDLQAILMEQSGATLSEMAGRVMLEWDAPGREVAVSNGTNIVTLDDVEVARWKEAAQPVVARWIEEVGERGVDGQAAIDEARALIDKHQQ